MLSGPGPGRRRERRETEAGENGCGSRALGSAPGYVVPLRSIDRPLSNGFMCRPLSRCARGLLRETSRCTAFLLDNSDIEPCQSGPEAVRLDFCPGDVVAVPDSTSEERVGG